MSEIDIHEALGDNAVDAPAPPQDLLDRVETGYRRRRRGRAITATFLSVALLALGAWVVLRPDAQRETLPAKPPVTFHVPSSIENAPPFEKVWPKSFVLDDRLPGTSPNALLVPVGLLDTGHVLVVGRDKFYSYDAQDKQLRVLVDATGITGQSSPQGQLAISPHWIVWQVNRANDFHHFDIYRAPITGGPKQRVAVVNAINPNEGYYATDEAVYWSPVNGGGVYRLSFADPKPVLVPGTVNMILDGTPWLSIKVPRPNTPNVPGGKSDDLAYRFGRPTAFRNVVTGELRPMVTPPDAAAVACVPTFCVGTTKTTKKKFVQRLDGSGRVELPMTGKISPNFVMPLRSDNGGVILMDNFTVLDPLTGVLAGPPFTGDCGFSPSSTKGAALLGKSDPVPGKKNYCGPTIHFTYIITN
jgi:hypothetical protein